MNDEQVRTPGSSNIASFAYVPARSALIIEFNNGVRFEYEKVPPSIFEDMKKAPSVGKFVHERVKGYYDGTKVSG